MKYFVASAAAICLPLAIACSGGGGGSSSNPPAPATKSFTLKTSTSLAGAKIMAKNMAADLGAGLVPAADVQFHLGIAANQGGTLIAGFSGDATTAEFAISSNVNGVTVGSNGVSETFTLATDPAVINAEAGFVSGTVKPDQGTVGLFMAKFGDGVSTTMALSAPSTPLTQVDEIVLRMANPEYVLLDGGGVKVAKVVSSPHYVYNSKLYASEIVDPYAQNTDIWAGNLLTKMTASDTGAPLMDMQYIFFMPSNILGAGKSFMVSGATILTATGVGGNAASYTNIAVVSPSHYQGDISGWVDNSPGILSAVNYFRGTSYATYGAAASDPEWQALAAYIHDYFVKYMVAGTIKFGPDGLGPHMGNTNTPSSFEIIAMDSLTLSATAVLNMQFDSPLTTEYDVTDPTMTVTGEPPIKFVTTVTQ